MRPLEIWNNFNLTTLLDPPQVPLQEIMDVQDFKCAKSTRRKNSVIKEAMGTQVQMEIDKSKLKPRGVGSLQMHQHITNKAYKIDPPPDKFAVSNSFHTSDLSPVHGDEESELRAPFQGGGSIPWS